MRTLTIGLAGVLLIGMTACHPSGSASSASSTAAAAPTAAATGPVSLSDLPHLAPGLWKQRRRASIPTACRARMPSTRKSASTRPMRRKSQSAFGAAMNKNRCASQSFTRNLDGSIAFSSTCAAPDGGQRTSTGTITGSFNSAYTIVLNSTSASAPADKMTINGVLEGPCPAGAKGGDVTVTLPNGQKTTMNMGNLTQ